MAYIHEMALKNAQKKLYMLGGSDRRNDRTGMGEETAQALGGFTKTVIGADQARRAQQALKAKAADEAERKDIDFIKGRDVNSPAQDERYFVSEGLAVPKVENDVSDLKNQVAINEMAEKTRMGGRYTPQGLQMTEVNAVKNADDRIRARALMGIGGSLRMEPPYGSY